MYKYQIKLDGKRKKTNDFLFFTRIDHSPIQPRWYERCFIEYENLNLLNDFNDCEHLSNTSVNKPYLLLK